MGIFERMSRHESMGILERMSRPESVRISLTL